MTTTNTTTDTTTHNKTNGTTNGLKPTTPPEVSHTDPHPHLTALQRDGYVVIRSLLPPHLLLALQATCKYLTGKARSGEWPYVRTVPKQYPPWPEIQPGEAPPNIWGIQHLLHPDMAVRDVFAECYFHPAILDVVKELVGLPVTPASDSQLVMELFNLLISPAQNTDFELCWHRDDIKPSVSPDEELSLLTQKSPSGRQLHAQYNIALWDDASLIVIPGSHARARTDIERSASAHATLPDQLTVSLSPGDAVFYNSNILHRGVYEGIDTRVSRGRMTLHGSVGLAGHGSERARQVLQHGVGTWVRRAGFPALQGREGEVAEGMRRRLVEMGTGEGIGYSLDG